MKGFINCTICTIFGSLENFLNNDFFINTNLSQTLSKNRRGTLRNLFCEVSITLIPKLKAIIRKLQTSIPREYRSKNP